MKIILNNICKSYNNRKVLDNIRFEFTSDRPVVIEGESGIGKTTLLRIIMGLDNADSGEVLFDGVERDAVRFAPVFQDTRLIESADAITNVKLACKGVPEDVIIKKLSALIPSEELHKKVSDLSGGTRRRVEIVRAVLAPSDVLIMDESLTGLDDENAAKAASYIHDNIGKRIFIASSHSDLFESFCTTLILS